MSAPSRPGSVESVLAGVLVTEIGSRVGVGIAGSILAQLGATVVIAEMTGTGTSSDKTLYRAQFAAGKLSIGTAKPDDPLLRDQLEASDIVLISSDMDAVRLPAAVTDPAVVCDITAYGRHARPAGPAHSDLQIQAVSGIAATTGLPNGPPVPITIPISEIMAGVYAAGAVLAAYRTKTRTGYGQTIDMALYDCAFAAMATFLPRVLIGDETPIRRIGNRHPMIAPWNVYKVQDGWILVCVGNDTQWRRFCEAICQPQCASDPRFLKTANRVANGDAVDAVVQGWIGSHSSAHCLSVLEEIEIASGPVAKVHGHPHESNLGYRDMIGHAQDPSSGLDLFLPESPLRMSRTPGRMAMRIPSVGGDRSAIAELLRSRKRASTKPDAAMDAPLKGLRIVEIGHYTTVPLSTRVLASIGADVIKIEPPEGEATRDWPPAQDGQGYFFTLMNSDKRSLVLDLRKEADAGVLRELLADADVLIENLKPGALARRGFSPDALAKINPALIYCSVSGFGTDSIYAGRPAYDTVVQAMSGMMDILRAEGTPIKHGISAADLLGAEFAVAAVLAAVLYRDRTGLGQFIDLAMQDIAAWSTQTAWNGGAAAAPQVQIVKCSDGDLLVEKCSTSGAEAVRASSGDLAEALSLTREELGKKLEAPGVRVAPVRSVHEMATSDQTRSRGLWFRAEGFGKSWPLLASPLRLTRPEAVVRMPMSPLGQDTLSILNGLEQKKKHPARQD